MNQTTTGYAAAPRGVDMSGEQPPGERLDRAVLDELRQIFQAPYEGHAILIDGALTHSALWWDVGLDWL